MQIDKFEETFRDNDGANFSISEQDTNSYLRLAKMKYRKSQTDFHLGMHKKTLVS